MQNMGVLMPVPVFAPTVRAQVDWQPLKDVLGDRLMEGVPIAQVCLDNDKAACAELQAKYIDGLYRSTFASAQIQTQWEACQTTGDQCLLDYTGTVDAETVLGETGCKKGSISDYYINVESAEDVQAGLEFAKANAIPLVVKNTGHDYKGRSSAPGSLALWTHNLNNISYSADFVPEGSTDGTSYSAITSGAGVQFIDLYNFADKHNVTAVGGSEKSVGASGGWLLGGGHSFLSPAHGLGVDRVLEIKVVTADGELRVANAYQNQDLFWAMRGGGGGTFGVVIESTSLALPQLTIQAAIISWNPATLDAKVAAQLSKDYLTLLVDNTESWISQGWGGATRAYVGAFVNSEINAEQAAEAIAPLKKFADDNKGNGVTLTVATFGSWMKFFSVFSAANPASVGKPLAQASRLVPDTNFQSPEARTELTGSLLDAYAESPALLILMTAPYSYEYEEGSTSVTEAWRNSFYHVSVITNWNWNATQADMIAAYAKSAKAIEKLRNITPDASYLNEGDVYEPNHEVSFWGTNYDKLLTIKDKYDPDRVFDCWNCVGWDASSSRYSCYLQQ